MATKKESNRIPKDARGLCWGGFFLTIFWGPFNSVWSSLLVLVPIVNIVIPFLMLFKGREWAWENNNWDDVEHFNKVQKRWTIAGIIFFLVPMILGIVAEIAIPNFKTYSAKAKRAEAKILLIGAYSNMMALNADYGTYDGDWQNGLATSNKPRYTLATVDTDPRLREYCPDCVITRDSFKIAAIGNIDTDSQLDILVIDDKKIIKVIVDDLDN